DLVPALGNAYAKDPTRTFTTAELVAYVYPRKDDPKPPGQAWSYTNTAYILSEMIIEKATGQRYSDEITRRFLRANLGLNDTFYSASVYPQALLDRTLHGYFFNTDPGNEPFKPLLGKDVRDDSVSWAQGAGAIIATPEDVTHWVRALYQGDILA